MKWPTNMATKVQHRKPVAHLRSHAIRATLTKKEASALTAAADKAKMTVSSLVRVALRKFGAIPAVIALVLFVMVATPACTKSAPPGVSQGSNQAAKFADLWIMKLVPTMACPPWTGRGTEIPGPDSVMCQMTGGTQLLFCQAPDDKIPTCASAADWTQKGAAPGQAAPAPAAAPTPAAVAPATPQTPAEDPAPKGKAPAKAKP